MPPRSKARRVIPSSPTASDSDSSIASSSSSSSPPSGNEKPSRSSRPAVNAKGGGLSFTTARPKSTSQQSKLSFAKQNGPAPPSRKRVKIQEPPPVSIRAPEPADVKGKGKAKQPAPQNDQAATTILWSQRYSPQTRADLAVHNRKVNDVSTWLREAFHGSPSLRRRRRFLVLTGPTGSAKTETILQLARDPELDFEVVEWKNETQARAGATDDGDYTFAENTISARLRDFFSKSARFPTLTLAPTRPDNSQPAPSTSSKSPPVHNKRRLILLEDLPSLSHQPTLDAFQGALSTMLVHTAEDPVPICIVLSDISAAGSAGDSSDGPSTSSKDRRETEWMRPRRLLGDDVANSDSWAEIKFNPIAPTLLKKALKATLSKATTTSSNVTFPGDAIIDAIANDSPGDIRAATDTLQQAYQAFVRDSKPFAPLTSAVKRTNGKRTHSAQVVRQEASKVLDGLGLVSRDSALVLFHALGKLLYNKRVGDPDDDDEGDDNESYAHADMDVDNAPLTLPDHYQHLARRKSRVDVKSILNSSLDLSTLSLFAHHNYPSYVTDIDQCEGIMESFSYCDSDLRLSSSSAYTDTNLQDHYTSLITSHSLLLHLPSPVPRKTNPPRRPPTKPDYFEAIALTRNEAQRMSQVARRVGLNGELRNARELALEWVPMVGKMLEASAAPAQSSSQTHLVHRLRREDKEELKRCNNFYPGLTPFASQAAKRFGWSNQASFDREEDEMQELILRDGQEGAATGHGSQEDASMFTEVDRADSGGTAATSGINAAVQNAVDDDGEQESGASDMEEIEEF